MSFMINRRRFLQTASASLAMSVLGVEGLELINQKPKRVGLIGTGWYGKNDLFRLIQVAPVEVVSLCDVDKNFLSDAAQLVSQRQKSKKVPRTYTDFRAMLKEKDLDIVVIGTPDHWHALQMRAAVEAGADVYVQKPISLDVIEGESMVAAARKHNRVVQSVPSAGALRTSSKRRRTSSKQGCSEQWGMWNCVATTTCAPTVIHRSPQCRTFWTTKCGLARRR